ncbi:expressed unknown protein [Seminavis robusta]|uniref:Uncharacterized protein n=1 Tax=Seminavis robusta TaxID=568900 RepID=A0A9N8EGG4_9STRA|nr:expressed unknown protein [Seminavis robusta]|eukprot:Sro909_g218940.1 n/a (250) ;mRNA; f:13290-14039
MPKEQVHLHWASTNKQQPCFCNPEIYLNVTKLKATPETIAAIFGVKEPETIELKERENGKIIALEEGEQPVWQLEPDCHYDVHVAGCKDSLAPAVPINQIFSLFPGDTDDEKSDNIQKLSENFYGKIWNDKETPKEFQDRFISLTSSASIQAFRQYDWFHEVFGGPSMMGSSNPRKSILLPKVMAKHTSSRMTREYAITWLEIMDKSVNEEFPNEETLQAALKLYWIHFFGWFPYSDEDRREFRRIVWK